MAQDYHNFNFAKILLFLFFLSKNIHHYYLTSFSMMSMRDLENLIHKYPIRFHVTTSISVGVNNNGK